MRVVAGPRGEFRKYLGRLRTRLARDQRAADKDELRKLYRLWNRAVASAPAGVGLGPLPSREDLEDEFGPEPADELAPEVESPAPGRHGSGRHGHDWPVQLIRDILDRARQGKGRPTIVDELSAKAYPNGLGATDHVVREVLGVVKRAGADGIHRLEKMLETTPEFPPGRGLITLEELEKAVVEPKS